MQNISKVILTLDETNRTIFFKWKKKKLWKVKLLYEKWKKTTKKRATKNIEKIKMNYKTKI